MENYVISLDILSLLWNIREDKFLLESSIGLQVNYKEVLFIKF